MTFSKLSEYFEKLEATSSRLALIDILSELFKHCSNKEIEQVVYLTQGRIAPFFSSFEIGMADKTVAQAIALAYGVTKDEVLKLYQKKGDMGLVAEQLIDRHSGECSDSRISKKTDSGQAIMTVLSVFEIMTEIAKTSGEGTVEKRITLLC